jgi:hypothetical protein
MAAASLCLRNLTSAAWTGDQLGFPAGAGPVTARDATPDRHPARRFRIKRLIRDGSEIPGGLVVCHFQLV